MFSVLSQSREKNLEFVEAENQGRNTKLMDIKTALSQNRDILTKIKQTKDTVEKEFEVAGEMGVAWG